MLCLVAQSCPTLWDPMNCNPPVASVHGDSPGENTGDCHALLHGNLLNQGINPRSSALQADSLPCDPPGKPKNTGMGNLSLLEGSFPTQESTSGLLRYRQILYQLRYQGSPSTPTSFFFFNSYTKIHPFPFKKKKLYKIVFSN